MVGQADFRESSVHSTSRAVRRLGADHRTIGVTQGRGPQLSLRGRRKRRGSGGLPEPRGEEQLLATSGQVGPRGW